MQILMFTRQRHPTVSLTPPPPPPQTKTKTNQEVFPCTLFFLSNKASGCVNISFARRNLEKQAYACMYNSNWNVSNNSTPRRQYWTWFPCLYVFRFSSPPPHPHPPEFLCVKPYENSTYSWYKVQGLKKECVFFKPQGFVLSQYTSRSRVLRTQD